MYSYEANGRGNTSATDAKLLERKSQFINLPAVTPADDGTVLGVAEGKWQPVPGDGGGDIYSAIVNSERDKIIKGTYAEIKEHITNGAPFTILIGNAAQTQWVYATYVHIDGTDILFGVGSPSFAWSEDNHVYRID